MATITTKAALAKTLNISKARVSQYIAKGMPVRPDGRLDREVAVKWLQNTILPKTAKSSGSRLLDVRVARELLQVQIAKLNLEERQGELVDAGEVERVWSYRLTELKNRIMAIESEARGQFGTDVGDFVRTRIRVALTELSGTGMAAVQ